MRVSKMECRLQIYKFILLCWNRFLTTFVFSVWSLYSDDADEENTNFFANQHSVFSEFCQALWFALIANTDVICYMFIFLNTILSMSIATLPMSLCVCLWATLTIPRPSKRFWLTIIAYTEVKILTTFSLLYVNEPIAPVPLILLFCIVFGIWQNNAKVVNWNSLYSKWFFTWFTSFQINLFTVLGLLGIFSSNNFSLSQGKNRQIRCHIQTYPFALCTVSQVMNASQVTFENYFKLF